MSSWRELGARPAHRGRGRAAHSGSQANHRHQPQPQRRMEHIASVSRSSGLEKDGDTLKDLTIQEEYRAFIQGKVQDVLKNYSRQAAESEEQRNQRINAQENLLILFRKLREGIFSSGRKDSFALDAYETSLHMAIAFDSPGQSNSIIPHLVPHLYLTCPPPQDNRLIITLISLLHYLVNNYPSQSSYRQLFATIPSEMLPEDSSPYKWIVSLAKSLRTQNYATFGALTKRSTIARLLTSHSDISGSLKTLSLSDISDGDSLYRQSLFGLVHSLRGKVRTNTWSVIRSAYREISCNVEETQDWLKQTLCLQSLVPYGHDIDPEQWLQEQSTFGHTRQKEGVEGRWMIYNVR